MDKKQSAIISPLKKNEIYKIAIKNIEKQLKKILSRNN